MCKKHPASCVFSFNPKGGVSVGYPAFLWRLLGSFPLPNENLKALNGFAAFLLVIMPCYDVFPTGCSLIGRGRNTRKI